MDPVHQDCRPRRCAIYTRKSAQPPLEQEITSLESQRSICSAYVASQRHKNWIELAKPYDDPGRSGASLVRPALQELVTDIELGLVDIVIVYKVDRITRTLLDFVRLIDFFDKYGVVFVSITQNFDTSDSMGRLIRNILLTFAQFEREIASDRMRDKKMVMKQRGFWTGGDPPIGYDLRRGRLVINLDEQKAVRRAFETYVETRSIAAVFHRLTADGYRRKLRRTAAGRKVGGGPISLTSLHHILRNPVYIGYVTHRGERFQGIHEPLLDQSTWDRVQAVLDERSQQKPRNANHILTGLLYDSYGRHMHGRIVTRPGRSNRYYASAVVKWGLQAKLRSTRAHAEHLEALVVASIAQLLSDRRKVRHALSDGALPVPELDRLCSLGCAAAARLTKLDVWNLTPVLNALIDRIEVQPERVRVAVRSEAIARFLVWDGVGKFCFEGVEFLRARQMHLIDIPVCVDRQRRKACIPIQRRTALCRSPSRDLVMLLEDARAAQKLIFDHRDVTLTEMAWSVGRKPASFSRLIRLNYLAPDIVTSIIDGTQPSDLTRRKLIECDLPMDWELQRRLLGFTPSHSDAIGNGGIADTSQQCGQLASINSMGIVRIKFGAGRIAVRA